MLAACIYCNGDGVISHGESIITCPHCGEIVAVLTNIEVAIAQLVLDGNEDDAYDLNTIYNLLQDCPVLAVLEAQEQDMPREFVDQIIEVFDVRKLE